MVMRVECLERMSGAFATESAKMSDQEFSYLVSIVESHLGLKMSASKKTMVAARLMRRLRELRLPDYASYCAHMRNPASFADEFPHFADLVTTHKTDFFREREHFDVLTRMVLPELLSERPRETPLRIWSAGCSTGQEPYTIAMVLEDHLGKNSLSGFSVLGTDVSESVIETAIRAVYPALTIEPISEEFRARYLMRSRDPALDHVRIVPTIRAKVDFDVLNFAATDWRLTESFDVIFCRNVLIYFNRAMQVKIIDRLCQHLRPGGYLFLGHSESYVGSTERVRLLPRSICQRI
jgi:chemotaxis protein methyltransferase CheR